MNIGIDLGTTNSALAYVAETVGSPDYPEIKVLEIPQYVAPAQIEPRRTLPSIFCKYSSNNSASDSLKRLVSTRMRLVMMQFALKGKLIFRVFGKHLIRSIQGTANPPKPAWHLTLCDLVLRRLAARSASISFSRSEAVRSVCVWWRPCSFPRPYRDSFRLYATRPFHIPITFHQPRRQICRRYIRTRLLTVRHRHE